MSMSQHVYELQACISHSRCACMYIYVMYTYRYTYIYIYMCYFHGPLDFYQYPPTLQSIGVYSIPLTYIYIYVYVSVFYIYICIDTLLYVQSYTTPPSIFLFNYTFSCLPGQNYSLYIFSYLCICSYIYTYVSIAHFISPYTQCVYEVSVYRNINDTIYTPILFHGYIHLIDIYIYFVCSLIHHFLSAQVLSYVGSHLPYKDCIIHPYIHIATTRLVHIQSICISMCMYVLGLINLFFAKVDVCLFPQQYSSIIRTGNPHTRVYIHRYTHTHKHRCMCHTYMYIHLQHIFFQYL